MHWLCFEARGLDLASLCSLFCELWSSLDFEHTELGTGERAAILTSCYFSTAVYILTPSAKETECEDLIVCPGENQFSCLLFLWDSACFLIFSLARWLALESTAPLLSGAPSLPLLPSVQSCGCTCLLFVHTQDAHLNPNNSFPLYPLSLWREVGGSSSCLRSFWVDHRRCETISTSFLFYLGTTDLLPRLY